MSGPMLHCERNDVVWHPITGVQDLCFCLSESRQVCSMSQKEVPKSNPVLTSLPVSGYNPREKAVYHRFAKKMLRLLYCSCSLLCSDKWTLQNVFLLGMCVECIASVNWSQFDIHNAFTFEIKQNYVQVHVTCVYTWVRLKIKHWTCMKVCVKNKWGHENDE